jgi:hypothetical protein
MWPPAMRDKCRRPVFFNAGSRKLNLDHLLEMPCAGRMQLYPRPSGIASAGPPTGACVSSLSSRPVRDFFCPSRPASPQKLTWIKDFKKAGTLR